MKYVFVGNLDVAATETSIRSFFKSYGTVDRVGGRALTTNEAKPKSSGGGFGGASRQKRESRW